jgi:hypothetical protein
MSKRLMAFPMGDWSDGRRAMGDLWANQKKGDTAVPHTAVLAPWANLGCEPAEAGYKSRLGTLLTILENNTRDKGLAIVVPTKGRPLHLDRKSLKLGNLR